MKPVLICFLDFSSLEPQRLHSLNFLADRTARKVDDGLRSYIQEIAFLRATSMLRPADPVGDPRPYVQVLDAKADYRLRLACPSGLLLNTLLGVSDST